jgi:hypothetical protein
MTFDDGAGSVSELPYCCRINFATHVGALHQFIAELSNLEKGEIGAVATLIGAS